MNKIVENLDSYISRVLHGEDTTLMARQFETIRKIRDFVAAGYTDGHVVKPTGIGKTVIFSKFIQAALRGLDFKVLIVGPTRIVLDQNKWKLDEFADIQAGSYHGTGKDLSHQVTVTTYHSLRNMIRNELIVPKEYKLLILDEAHRALGEETIAAVEAFEDCLKIGFTATPEFHEEKSVADLLPFVIDEMSVREAIEGNLLAGVRVYMMPTGVSIKDVALKGKDFDEVSLTQRLNTPERNQHIARLYLDERFNGKRAVVYGASCDHARGLTLAFKKLKVPVAYIDGQTSETEREKILTKFQHGDIKVLCNVRVLVEGFDSPEAEVCINATPTLSKVVAEQRGGRVLRRSRKKDNKIGCIVEIIDDFGDGVHTPVLFSEIAGAAEILAPSNIDVEEKPKKLGSLPSPAKPNVVAKPGEVIDDPETIMNLSNRNRRQRYTKMFEYAPRGWVHARRLAHELHVKESEIRIAAEQNAVAQPDWFKRYLTPTDILVTHYHPKLAVTIMRVFKNRLVDFVTPDEYGDAGVLELNTATRLLETVDQIVEDKAMYIAGTTFYSKHSHIKVIEDIRKTVRDEEFLLQTDAEARFWEDDDRSDEEREREYWLSFEEISSESKEVSVVEFDPDPFLNHEGMLVFDEDRHIPFVQDEPAVQLLSDSVRHKVHAWVKLLPEHYAEVVQEVYFLDKNPNAVAKEKKKDRQSVYNYVRRAQRLLGSRRWLIYLWDYEGTEDHQLRYFPDLTNIEKRQMNSTTCQYLDLLLEKYHKEKCYLVNLLLGY